MPIRGIYLHAKVLLYFEMTNFLMAFLAESEKVVREKTFSGKSTMGFCCFFIIFANKLILR